MISITYQKKGLHKYTGKILGFIDIMQFHNLMKDPNDLGRKLSTVNTHTIEEIADVKNVNSHRLVFRLSTDNAETKLLVTAEISRLSSTRFNGLMEVTLEDVNKDVIQLRELDK